MSQIHSDYFGEWRTLWTGPEPWDEAITFIVNIIATSTDKEGWRNARYRILDEDGNVRIEFIGSFIAMKRDIYAQ